MCGAYPSSKDDVKHEIRLSRLVQAGVTTFVALMNELDLSKDEKRWRGSKGIFRPYLKDAQRLQRASCTTSPTIQFIQLRVQDGSTPAVQETLAFVKNLLLPLLSQEQQIIYIHCRMGNGRTGVLAAVLLGILYPNLSSNECLVRVQAYHFCRKILPDLETPQTQRQREHVIDVLNIYRASTIDAKESHP